MDRLAPLHNAPAVVASALYLEYQFPQIPTDIAHPKVASCFVEAHAPRVAKPIRPYFRSCSFDPDERIIWRHTISLAGLAVVDVDAKNGRQKVTDVLAGFKPVRRVRGLGIAGGNIEHPILAKVQRTTIVSARQPGDQHLAGARIETGRAILFWDLVPSYMSSVLGFPSQNITKKDLTCFIKIGMKL